MVLIGLHPTPVRLTLTAEAYTLLREIVLSLEFSIVNTPYSGRSIWTVIFWLTNIGYPPNASPLHPTPYTLLPTPYSLHPTPYSLLPTPYTLLPTPYTLLPTPYSLLQLKHWYKLKHPQSQLLSRDRSGFKHSHHVIGLGIAARCPCQPLGND